MFYINLGTLKTGQQINICGDNIKRKKLKVSKLCRLHSNEMQDIVEAKAGDIIAIVGLDCASGKFKRGQNVGQ